jgi:endonuclease G
MNDRQADFATYLQQLRERDPAIRDSLDQVLQERVTAEHVDEASIEISPEAIVLTHGRPVLDVKRGAAVLDTEEIESQVWSDRLTSASERLAGNIPAVGRIEISNHPRGVQWIGTGWVLRDNVVVTNRHVAEIFADAAGENFRFRPGLDESPMRAAIDFLEEFDSHASPEFPLFKVLHMERGGGPDLAFLRIEPVGGQELPSPVEIASQSAVEGDLIAVIGYPARDPFFPRPQLMDRIFGNRYDKKRLAPGMVIGTSRDRLFHDCSTLGGNSGGEVVSLASGQAVALHFAGTLFSKNHAVPALVVAQRLDDVRRGPVRRPASPDSAPAEPRTMPQTCSTGTGQAAAPRIIEATIPIGVRIELGNVSPARDIASPSVPAALAATLVSAAPRREDDVEEITEARPEDYVDRNGYDPQFLSEAVTVPLPAVTRQAA